MLSIICGVAGYGIGRMSNPNATLRDNLIGAWAVIGAAAVAIFLALIGAWE